MTETTTTEIDPYSARVLIIDDEIDITMILEMNLKHQGYTNTKTVNDPRQAVSTYTSFRPDIVLCDLSMPHVSGFEVIEQLKELERGSYTPVLVMTALNDSRSRLLAFRLGAKDYLTKPFDFNEVNARIRNQLEVRLLYNRLANSNHILENTVRERTEELVEANRELTRSNTELRMFAYIASHDLKEPVRMVSLNCQMLGRRYQDRLDDDGRTMIRFASEGAKRMQQLIDSLLAYSRVDTQGGAFTENDLNVIVNQAIADLGVAIEESGATVTHDDLPTFVADGVQIRQMMQNLIGNAIKFRGSRLPEVHVSGGRTDDGWHVSVRDNGIGIAEQYYERIFMIFQRLHRREEYPGTGAGLAICKRVVERHGGRIWVESTPGEGSTFHFTIPIREEESDEPA
ncbi:MAG: ATP-binding protein [Candidatus Poribacteria bacterium]|nr:ATP-binding protein [Candidatus Poribacteria bacterium]